MSQYMTFVVRKGDIFTPIYTCGRLSGVFQSLEGAVDHGQLTEVYKDELTECIERERACARDLMKDVEAIEINKKLVADWNNSIEEKLEALSQYDSSRQEILDCVEEAQATVAKLQFLCDIIEELEYFEDYSKKEAGLYAGIEISCNPSLEDLRK